MKGWEDELGTTAPALEIDRMSTSAYEPVTHEAVQKLNKEFGRQLKLPGKAAELTEMELLRLPKADLNNIRVYLEERKMKLRRRIADEQMELAE